MIEIDDVLISDAAWTAHFACDVSACKGICCRLGDLGAPLAEDEAAAIGEILPELTPYIGATTVKTLLEGGHTETYRGGLHVREFVPDTPCPLGFEDHQGVVHCALHRRALDRGLPVFDQKPLWCLLYPMIITQAAGIWQINFDPRPECRSVANAPPLLEFMAGPLASMFGETWLAKARHERARGRRP